MCVCKYVQKTLLEMGFMGFTCQEKVERGFMTNSEACMATSMSKY
jgi:hypothetical protein